jgi:hypothetical protein
MRLVGAARDGRSANRAAGRAGRQGSAPWGWRTRALCRQGGRARGEAGRRALVMSHTTGRNSVMGTPPATTACCSASRRSRRRATATTRRPAPASAVQTAQPMPADAPVTSATRPRQLAAPAAGGVSARDGAVANGAAYGRSAYGPVRGRLCAAPPAQCRPISRCPRTRPPRAPRARASWRPLQRGRASKKAGWQAVRLMYTCKQAVTWHKNLSVASPAPAAVAHGLGRHSRACLAPLQARRCGRGGALSRCGGRRGHRRRRRLLRAGTRRRGRLGRSRGSAARGRSRRPGRRRRRAGRAAQQRLGLRRRRTSAVGGASGAVGRSSGAAVAAACGRLFVRDQRDGARPRPAAGADLQRRHAALASPWPHSPVPGPRWCRHSAYSACSAMAMPGGLLRCCCLGRALACHDSGRDPTLAAVLYTGLARVPGPGCGTHCDAARAQAVFAVGWMPEHASRAAPLPPKKKKKKI